MANPEKKFKCGQVSATVWKNEREKDGQKFDSYSIQIVKSYKDGEEWKDTNNYQPQDAHKVMTVTQKAFEFISLKTD